MKTDEEMERLMLDEEKTWTVKGHTVVYWSHVIAATSSEEAEQKSQDYWLLNTISEDVTVDEIYEGE